jgi:restriction system protein
VAEAYSRQGYRVEETGQGGADGGIDLLLTKDGATTLVQCKQWRARQVGVSVVREMFGLMHHHGAAAVKVVCTGVFSSDCYRFAVGKPLELVDGEALLELVKAVQTSSGQPPPVEQAPINSTKAPTCPKCSSTMVLRANRTTGEQFWGCPAYPACRGTVAMA